MKKTTQHIAAGLLALFTSGAAAHDDHYVGLHITVPMTLDAVGVQVVGRAGNGEARAGLDSRGFYQIGLGATGGGDVVTSGGAAWSSRQGQVVPYLAGAYGTGDWEAGAVTYGLDAETTYGFVGHRAWRSDGHGNGHTTDGGGDDGGDGDSGDGSDGGDNAGSSPVDDGGGEDGGSHDGGSDGSASDDGAGDNPGDTGGGDDGHGGGADRPDQDNRSGLGDDTNPGRGDGRDNSPNIGTDNPHRGGRP